jgi:hypothetical protein
MAVQGGHAVLRLLRHDPYRDLAEADAGGTVPDVINGNRRREQAHGHGLQSTFMLEKWA